MGIIEKIKQVDTELFLFLNGKHNPFFDVVMYWVSHKFFWIPLYAFFLFIAYKIYRKKVWLLALTATLAIVLSDQISTQLFKNYFLRYRPCHNLLIQAQVHVNGNCGGMYGFVSSHAANAFTIAMLLFLLFKNKINYFGILIFVWAAFVSYSRIYNGVHYPADIAVGALLGTAIGAIMFKVFQFVDNRLIHE